MLRMLGNEVALNLPEWVNENGSASGEMMIKLKIECVDGRYLSEQCVRVIALGDSATLLDLHELIQDAVSFDRDHPFDFYTANSASRRAEKHWIVSIETENWEDRLSAFAKIKLADIWPLGRRKLYYWFDFGDDWIVEVRKIRPSKSDDSIPCPSVLERIGPDPIQYPICEEQVYPNAHAAGPIGFRGHFNQQGPARPGMLFMTK